MPELGYCTLLENGELSKRRHRKGTEKEMMTYFFATGQIDKVELAAEFLLCSSVLLLHVDLEDTVTSGAVLIHVYKNTLKLT
jgi:hypothetical protein